MKKGRLRTHLDPRTHDDTTGMGKQKTGTDAGPTVDLAAVERQIQSSCEGAQKRPPSPMESRGEAEEECGSNRWFPDEPDQEMSGGGLRCPQDPPGILKELLPRRSIALLSA